MIMEKVAKVETTRVSQKRRRKKNNNKKQIPLSLGEFTKKMYTNLMIFIGIINFVIVR